MSPWALFCRHPCELGGAAWLAVVLENPCTCIVTCVVYSQCYPGEHIIPDAALFGALGALVAVLLASLGTFMLSLDHRAYLHTFYSRETGPPFVERQFMYHVANDELRSDIFTYNERLWRSFRAAVISWVLARYVVWTAQAWFTPAVQATIPAGVIPNLLTSSATSGVDASQVGSARASE